MATATKTFDTPNHRTIADLLEQLGDIPAERVRWQPRPGTATERDVINIHDSENRLCELVDGTLVEKVLGFEESIFAVYLAGSPFNFIRGRLDAKLLAVDSIRRQLLRGRMIPWSITALIPRAKSPTGPRDSWPLHPSRS